MASRKLPEQQDKVEHSDTPKDVIMSIRIEGAMHERLRKLAFDRRKPMRDFIVEGIETVLKTERA